MRGRLLLSCASALWTFWEHLACFVAEEEDADDSFLYSNALSLLEGAHTDMCLFVF